MLKSSASTLSTAFSRIDILPARLKILPTLLLLLVFCTAYAQEPEKEKKDPKKMYEGIQKYSGKSKFTKFMHKLIFKPVQSTRTLNRKKEVIKNEDFRRFQGKILRNINITTLDPFGYSERDEKRKPKYWSERTGNNLHVKSKYFAIRNFLLIKKNEPLDSLLVRESERLIRSQRFVRSVRITPVMAGADSVDVEIRVLDSWSLIPDATLSANESYLKLTERNFFGLGHQAEAGHRKRFDTGKDGYLARYTVPNIYSTYIKTTLSYETDVDNDYQKSINVERNFFSPFTKWAGGVYLGQQFWSDTLADAEGAFERQNFKFNAYDYWGGYSHQIFKGNTEADRTTNIILTTRYLNKTFIEKPSEVYDPDLFYRDEDFYMVSIGLSSRQFFQDKYIFNYGITEDVPTGRVFALTLGRQEKENRWRTYAGARISAGKFFDWGYLSGNAEYGTFYDSKEPEQGALSLQANYFTELIEIGTWKLRQFVKARYVWGYDRMRAKDDLVSLNDRNGIAGFNARELLGTEKFIATFQTQGYSPWNLGGFRINPYLSYCAGLLGTPQKSMTKSRMYSQVGLGVIISNDYLVFSQFQLSLAYYPTIPGNGDNIFKTNAFNTEDFGFQHFDMGKPRTVDYQ